MRTIHWLSVLYFLILTGVAQAEALHERIMQLRPATAPNLTIHGHAAINEALEKTGRTRVIVRLTPPAELTDGFSHEANLGNPSAVKRQRNHIANVQHAILSRVSPVHAETSKRFDFIPYLALEVDQQEYEQLLLSPDIEAVEEDTASSPALMQSVPHIGGVSGEFAGYTGKGQTIAILDSGVDKTHPFLTGKVVAEACFSTTTVNATALCAGGSTAAGSGNPCDVASIEACRHGTHVAGIAAGNNGSFSGVARDATLIAIQIFSRYPAGSCGGAPCLQSLASDQIAALNHVYNLRDTYRIAAVNLSIGGGSNASYCDAAQSAMKSAIDALRSVNVATIVAAGNDGSFTGISSPACISSAVSVGATTRSDTVENNSNSAAILKLLAPGSAIYSSVPGGGYQTFDGTSAAAPHVAGAWAVLKSARPNATVPELLNALQSTGVPVTDQRNKIVKPRIDLGAAVQFLSPNAPPTVTLTEPLNGATYPEPAVIALSAEVSDSGGTVAGVEFYSGTTLLAATSTAPYRHVWTGVPSGSYTLSARVIDNRGASAATPPVTVNVTSGGPVNVALAAHGGTATASSSGSLPPAAVIDGDRRGLTSQGAPWMWRDTTYNAWPDWVQVTFDGLKTIEEIDLFTAQDSLTAPLAPATGMTFVKNGIADFDVQYWNGAVWTTLPGGNITHNSLVWRTITFPPVTTDRVRVVVNGSLSGNSRITEIEAYAAQTHVTVTPTVALTEPLNGAGYTAPATITLKATASEAGGTVSKVEFYHGTNLIGAVGAVPYGFTWANVPPGTYTVTAVVTDSAGKTAVSAPAVVTVAGGVRTNVALAANGGVATASTYASLPPKAANDGDRKGLNAAGGAWMWRDTSYHAWPDWLQVAFDGPKTIGEISIFTAQDNLTAPVAPFTGQTFARYGITDFDVQYWNGTDWATLQRIIDNNLVWRTITFPAVTTDKIRVVVNASLANNSRITEIEAY